MLAMTLVALLGQVDGLPADAPLLAQANPAAPPAQEVPAPAAVTEPPVVSEPPPPPAPAPASFIDPDRARLEYDLSQLKRDRPHFALPVTLMAAGTTVLAVALLVGLGGASTFALVTALVGAAVATVGVVTFVIAVNRIGVLDKQIAEKQAELSRLLARPTTAAPPPM